MKQENRGKRRGIIYNRDERLEEQIYVEFGRCLKDRLDAIKEEDEGLCREISRAIRDISMPYHKISYKKLFDVIKIMEKDPERAITFKTLFDLATELECGRKDIVWGWTERTSQYGDNAAEDTGTADFATIRRNQKVARDNEKIKGMKLYVQKVPGKENLPNHDTSLNQQMHDTLIKLDDDTLDKIYQYVIATLPKELSSLVNGKQERCRPTIRATYTLDRIYGQTQRIALEEYLNVAKFSGEEKDIRRPYSFGDIMKIANYTGISPHWLFACDSYLDIDPKKNNKETTTADIANCEITIYSDNLTIERIMDIFSLMNNKQKATLLYAAQAALPHLSK